MRRSDGDPVIAGTVATDSGVRVEITAIGEDTALAGIQKLVTEAQSSSSRAQRLADKAAGWLFWFALGAAAIDRSLERGSRKHFKSLGPHTSESHRATESSAWPRAPALCVFTACLMHILLLFAFAIE